MNQINQKIGISPKNYLTIYVYGSVIILTGLFLLFSGLYSYTIIQITLGVSLIVAALFAFITMFSPQWKYTASVYHKMHASALLIYGVSVLLFCNTLETLATATSFLFFFYAFSEIIFCNWLFNLRQKLLYKIILSRLVLGLIIGIGVVIIMYYPNIPAQKDLENFGILYLLVGINILLYVPVIKSKKELN